MKNLPLALSLWGIEKNYFQTYTDGPQEARALSKTYTAHTLSVPVDHFQNSSIYEPHSSEKFNLRYWFDAQYYKPGGPVIVYQGGETNGQLGLSVLDHGIIAKLANATRGIGVVLEHRYYGESHPTADYSTPNLRFLTTEQAVADAAYFARNIVYPGWDQHKLTSRDTPYISYGISYAGAFSAILRSQWPHDYWGAISSSGTPQATVNFWQYYQSISKYGPPKCMEMQRTLMSVVDQILLGKTGRRPRLPACLSCQLKDLFGMRNLTNDDDFARVLVKPLHSFQFRRWWHPTQGNNTFDQYCSNITHQTVLWPETANSRKRAHDLMVASGVAPTKERVTSMLNLIGYIKNFTKHSCASNGLNACFSARQPAFYAMSDLKQNWRPWAWQYCTEWGFHATGSGAPIYVRPIVSRLITPQYLSILCREAFDRHKPANVSAVLQYGGYRLAYDRLAWLDGEEDPWRPVGVHGFQNGAPRRCSTTMRPFHLIKGAVHGWDAKSVSKNETTPTYPPKPVQAAQNKMVAFTKAWVKQWHAKNDDEETIRGLYEDELEEDEEEAELANTCEESSEPLGDE